MYSPSRLGFKVKIKPTSYHFEKAETAVKWPNVNPRKNSSARCSGCYITLGRSCHEMRVFSDRDLDTGDCYYAKM